MTDKQRVAIVDELGKHIAAIYVTPGTKDFEGAVLEGFVIPGITTLRGRSFRNAKMYWAMMAGADLSGCNFEGADMRGANLRDAKLVNANLRDADLGLDNLGGATQLQGADLTDAILHGAKLAGAEYDDRTRFPDEFVPEQAGMRAE
jgi:uncharacterized protein YjbI with pentapeptide repeats